MPYQSCAGAIAGNIALDCAKPNVGGYTGRGVYIPRRYMSAAGFGILQDATNPRFVESITLAEGQKVVVLDNVFAATPLDGSSTTGSTDSGRTKFNKAVAFRIPLRGAEASANIVEPLLSEPLGGILLLEKRSTASDGAIEVIGLEDGAKVDPTTMTRNENENGGDWTCTANASENRAEYVLDPDHAGAGETETEKYQAALAAFEALIAKGY